MAHRMIRDYHEPDGSVAAGVLWAFAFTVLGAAIAVAIVLALP